MNAAIATAPETTEAAPVEAAAESGASFSLEDALADATTEQAPEQPAEAAEEVTEQPKEEPKPEKPRKGAIAWDKLFNEAQLETPEGLKSARDAVLEARRVAHREYFDFKKVEQKFARTKAETLQLKQNLTAQYQMFQTNIQALRTGDRRTALQALGQLTGKDPVEILQELNVAIATDGKHRKATPVEEELRKEIAELKASIKGEREQEARQREEQEARSFVERRKSELASLAQQPERFPHLSALAAENPKGVGDYAAQYVIRTFNETGERLSDEVALGHIEAELADFARKTAQAANPGTPNGGAGRGTSAVRAANPEQAQRPPPIGQSLTPSSTSQQVGSRRPVTEDESLAVAARDLPDDFWAQFGM